MAARVEDTVGMVKAAGGAGGELRTLMMAALLLADRLHDLEAGAPVAAAPAPPPPAPAPAKLDPALVKRLVHAAERAEQIAAALEAA